MSGVLCAVYTIRYPSVAFYLLPMRAWQMGLGSLGALVETTSLLARYSARLVWIGIALIILIPAFPLSEIHPGVDSILVCVATLVVVLARSPRLSALAVTGALAVFGNWSYSLYLVHWPLLAFAGNAYLRGIPQPVRIGLLGVAIGAGYLLYRVVERPLRHSPAVTPRILLSSTAALATVALLVIPLSSDGIDYAKARATNYGFDSACEFTADFTDSALCRNAERPNILIWGDSYAMHLVDGVAATSPEGVVQATMSMCGPLLDLAPLDEPRLNRRWAEQCLSFNRSVLRYLAAPGSPALVILSSVFMQYVDPLDDLAPDALLAASPQGDQVIKVDAAAAASSLRRTISALQGLNKTVVLVAPPPKASFNVGLCLERRRTGKIILPRSDATCEIPAEEHYRHSAAVKTLLRDAARSTDTRLIEFDDVLCDGTRCRTELDGTFLYRDSGHLSEQGSIRLATHMNLNAAIYESPQPLEGSPTSP